MIQDQPTANQDWLSSSEGSEVARLSAYKAGLSPLSHLLENQELVSDPHVSPWTHVTHGDFWAGQSSSYLVEFTFSCETRMECSVSVSQGINRRSSAESRLSSSRDLLPKIRA